MLQEPRIEYKSELHTRTRGLFMFMLLTNDSSSTKHILLSEKTNAPGVLFARVGGEIAADNEMESIVL
jgi:hypothetical protein